MLNMKKTENVEPEAQKTEAQKVEAQKVAAATNVEVAQATYPEGILGSKSDKIVLLNPLGDPSRLDITTRKVDGKEIKSTCSTIVGYKFKALEDVDVPECGLGEDARKNPMSFKETGKTKHVKAGETFDLTRFEAGVLLSQPQYNANICGEGHEYAVVYTKAANAPKGADGAARVAGANLPTVSLRGLNGVSIKDLKMIDVLSFESETYTDKEGKTRNRITSRTVTKGYEKWAPMCQTVHRAPGAGSRTAEDKNVRSASAEAFLQMVAKKRG